MGGTLIVTQSGYFLLELSEVPEGLSIHSDCHSLALYSLSCIIEDCLNAGMILCGQRVLRDRTLSGIVQIMSKHRVKKAVDKISWHLRELWTVLRPELRDMMARGHNICQS